MNVLPPELLTRIARRRRVLDRVRRVLIDRLRLERLPDEIDPDVALFGTGLALDSVDALELVVSLEAEFGRLLPQDASVRHHLRTVGTVVDWALAPVGPETP